MYSLAVLPWFRQVQNTCQGIWFMYMNKKLYTTFMLKLSAAYYEQPVLSLRTGSAIGTAHTPIINPNNLKIVGWYASNLLEKGDYILPIDDVRDFIQKGIVVDDYTALTLPEDMIRLQDIIRINFSVLSKVVLDENKHRLGKVVDFAVDDSSNYIQKLYVNPSLLKGFLTDQMIIDRSAIIEITDNKIFVSGSNAKDKSRVRAPAGAGI